MEATTAHSPFDPLASAALLRQAAFSLIALLSTYPGRKAEAAVSRAISASIPNLAQALNYEPLISTPIAHIDNGNLPEAIAIARHEYTRVFYTDHILQARGSRYLGRDEQADLQRTIAELGLRRAASFTEPVDHISCEAELIAYCAYMEQAAWTGSDATSAREWCATGASLWRNHAEAFFVPFAKDVLAISNCAYFFIWGNLVLMTAGAEPFGR